MDSEDKKNSKFRNVQCYQDCLTFQLSKYNVTKNMFITFSWMTFNSIHFQFLSDFQGTNICSSALRLKFLLFLTTLSDDIALHKFQT